MNDIIIVVHSYGPTTRNDEIIEKTKRKHEKRCHDFSQSRNLFVVLPPVEKKSLSPHPFLFFLGGVWGWVEGDWHREYLPSLLLTTTNKRLFVYYTIIQPHEAKQTVFSGSIRQKRIPRQPHFHSSSTPDTVHRKKNQNKIVFFRSTSSLATQVRDTTHDDNHNISLGRNQLIKFFPKWEISFSS